MTWLLWIVRIVVLLLLCASFALPFARPHQYWKQIIAFTAEMLDLSLGSAAVAVSVALPIAIFVLLFFLFGGRKFKGYGGGG